MTRAEMDELTGRSNDRGDGAIRLRASSGFWAVVLSVVHVATTPVFYEQSVRSILDGGIIGALDADPRLSTLRGASFWYTTTGLVLGLFGLSTLRAERRGRGCPQGVALTMAVTGVWGALISPRSGFWFHLPIAYLARRNERTTEDMTRQRARRLDGIRRTTI